MDRKVESLVILVVDALRFDFALYNLPKSIGRRLDEIQQQQTLWKNQHNNNHGEQQQSLPDWTNRSSRLLQFVADPPTVTMQRLKALTTGGLPTFADISANLGGASVDEDSWVQMLRRLPYQDRGLTVPAQAGFVGDDTWVDLYPQGFTDAFPYPSFNTRDLNTVDGGCEKHIPDLVDRLRQKSQRRQDELELMVVHFLGVDHVGHTYGPHNKHMDDKLRQMDQDLALILDTLDDAIDSCHTTLIFGDHGMTEDGNHGGGTEEEIAAALFVHVSKGCGALHEEHDGIMETQRQSELVHSVFGAIYQIDLVPTITTLLGLPIPFANLGGLDPTLLPGSSPVHTATALALNAAQVWRYFTVYSETANRLPGLPPLEAELKMAVSAFAKALSDHDNPDPDHFIQASTLLKSFLKNALALGQHVWTRFDSVGMVGGVLVFVFGIVLHTWPLVKDIWQVATGKWRFPWSHLNEMALTMLLILFTCGLCTFSNSYILEEENSIMFALSVLSIAIALRIRTANRESMAWIAIPIVPVLSRLAELFISGHGMDPSIPVHAAHHSGVFLTSLALIVLIRWTLFRYRLMDSVAHLVADLAALFFLALAWWEKRQPNQELNGYVYCRIEVVILSISLVVALAQGMTRPSSPRNSSKSNLLRVEDDLLVVLFKLLVGVMTVTGPSSSTSMLFFMVQMSILYFLSSSPFESTYVTSMVVGALLRFVTRHAFFATNHGCAFNRLQLSAAFVATTEFYYEVGGISLFLNTFGWEMAGIMIAWMLSRREQQSNLWRVYGLYQLIEAVTSCISVSVLRRHLMVWDIYAPHFLFAAIFTILHGLAQITAILLSML